MECKKIDNHEKCACTYEPCPRKSVCCDCISYHLRSKEIPGCFFPAEAEKPYNGSFTHFAKLVNTGRI